MTPDRPEQGAPERHEGAVRDHLANERTLLAWQRTALALIGIGFVVDRLGLGVSPDPTDTLVALLLVGLGGAASLVGAYRFFRTEQEIERGDFRSGVLVHLLLTLAVVAGAVALAALIVRAD